MEEVEHEPGSEGDGKSIHAGMERPRSCSPGGTRLASAIGELCEIQTMTSAKAERPSDRDIFRSVARVAALGVFGSSGPCRVRFRVANAFRGKRGWRLILPS